MDDRTRSELVELLGAMESRLGLRFTGMETRLTGMETQLTGMETRLESALKSYVDERLSDFESHVKSYIRERLAETEAKFLSAFFTYQEYAEGKFCKMSTDELRPWMGGQPPAAT